MRNKSNFRIVMMVLLFIVGSCKDDEPASTGFGDVFIIVKKNGAQTLYGLSLHAFSTASFDSVKAYAKTNPGTVYKLKPYQSLLSDYVYETPPNGFSTALPATGDYFFKVRYHKGDTVTYIDKLFEEVVMPPVISKCTYNQNLKEVELEWETVENASFYNIKMMDSQGKIVFISPVFNQGRTKYFFGRDTQGWQLGSNPAANMQYTVEISTYRLESGGDDTNFQATGRAIHPVTWGS